MKCSVNGCKKEARSNGLCNTHASYARRYGLLPNSRKCTVQGCERFEYAKGYCSLHYQRFKKFGDPMENVKPRVFKHPIGTIVPERPIDNSYLVIKVKDIGVKDIDWIYHHRFIMEQHLSRKLTSEEYVHHKNGNKQDNRISNLELTNSSDHASHHFSGPRKFTDEILFNDIRTIYKQSGNYISAKIYNEKGITHSNTMINRFGSWNKAKELAGVNNIVTT